MKELPNKQNINIFSEYASRHPIQIALLMATLLLSFYFIDNKILPPLTIDNIIPISLFILLFSVSLFFIGGLCISAQGFLAKKSDPTGYLEELITNQNKYMSIDVKKQSTLRNILFRAYIVFIPALSSLMILVLAALFKQKENYIAVLFFATPIIMSFLGLIWLNKEVVKSKKAFEFSVINGYCSVLAAVTSIIVFIVAYHFIESNQFSVFKVLHLAEPYATYVGFTAFLVYFFIMNYKLAWYSGDPKSFTFLSAFSGGIAIILLLIMAGKVNWISETVLSYFKKGAYTAEHVTFYGNSCDFIFKRTTLQWNKMATVNCDYESVYVYSDIGDEGVFGIKGPNNEYERFSAPKGDFRVHTSVKANKIQQSKILK
jgi:hypothetical protein